MDKRGFGNVNSDLPRLKQLTFMHFPGAGRSKGNQIFFSFRAKLRVGVLEYS